MTHPVPINISSWEPAESGCLLFVLRLQIKKRVRYFDFDTKREAEGFAVHCIARSDWPVGWSLFKRDEEGE